MLSGHTSALAPAPAPTVPPGTPLHGIIHATRQERRQERKALRKMGMARPTPMHPHLPASVPRGVARLGLERLAHLVQLRNMFIPSNSTADWHPWPRLSPSNRRVVRVLILVPDALALGLAQGSLRTLLRRNRPAETLHVRPRGTCPGRLVLKKKEKIHSAYPHPCRF